MKHLYWAHDRPSWTKLFGATTIGYSACGRRLPKASLTRFPDDNECEACRRKPEAAVVESPAMKSKPVRYKYGGSR